MTAAVADGDPISSGLPTLDVILGGGFAANRAHLIEGRPGSGKTTLALQFLVAGSAIGERGLYLTLSESRSELLHVAKTHGMDLSNITISELVPTEVTLAAEMEQTIFHASDLELSETVQALMDTVRAVNPRRVVLDSLSEIRMLCQNPLRFRRQARALKNFFAQSGCTVVLLDGVDEQLSDDINLHSLVHGVIRLEHNANSYGAERRRLRVYKMRAAAFIGGYHDYKIVNGGIKVFPRLVASSAGEADRSGGKVASGIPALDAMLNGGLDRGTTTLIAGPTGVGKTSLGLQFMHRMAQDGERTLFISFDETERNFCRRCTGLGVDLAPLFADGRFQFQAANPAEMTPGELIDAIRCNVDAGVTGIVIDSLNGYRHAMPEEKFLLLRLHELVTFLANRNVTTVLIVGESGLLGPVESPFEIAYLADTIVLMRYFEADREIRRAVGVVKTTTGPHAITLHELKMTRSGVSIDTERLDLARVLAGTPRYGSAPAGPEPARP